MQNSGLKIKIQAVTKFEFMVSVCLICIFIIIAINQIRASFGRAERVAVNEVVVNIRSAISLENMQMLLSHVNATKSCLNPMDYLRIKPQNYLGATDSLNIKKISAGNWIFDSNTCRLIYKVKFPEVFKDTTRKQPILVYSIRKIPSKNPATGLTQEEFKLEFTGGSKVR